MPVVPEGLATANQSWKRWVFQNSHCGLFGSHRSAEKTLMIMKRQVYWDGMSTDVTKWVDKCMTCLRFRKMAQKQESPDVVPVAYECWSWVMVDLEGPSTPADFDGCIYAMTYICCVCNGILIEKSSKCNAREARRMFAACVFRSGTIRSMFNTDRGSEFKNCLLYTSPSPRDRQ